MALGTKRIVRRPSAGRRVAKSVEAQPGSVPLVVSGSLGTRNMVLYFLSSFFFSHSYQSRAVNSPNGWGSALWALSFVVAFLLQHPHLTPISRGVVCALGALVAGHRALLAHTSSQVLYLSWLRLLAKLRAVFLGHSCWRRQVRSALFHVPFLIAW